MRARNINDAMSTSRDMSKHGKHERKQNLHQ